MRSSIISALMLSVLVMTLSPSTAPAPAKPASALAPVPVSSIWAKELGAQPSQVSMAVAIANQYKVPAELVVAIITVESNWREMRVGKNSNGSEDYGLMQINNRNYDEFRWRFWNCTNYDLLDAETNIRTGVMYLSHLRKSFASWEEVTVAYNCGPTAAKRATIPGSTKAYAAQVASIVKSLKK